MMPFVAQTAVQSRSRRLLTLLVVSLTGCASTLPPAMPKIPAAPELTQPPPAEPYSQSVQRDIQNWRQKLTAIPPMP